MPSFMFAVDWLNVIAGFLLGLIPLFLPVVVRQVRSTFSSEGKQYYGNYLVYHRSGTDPKIIRSKRLTLFRSLLGNDRVRGQRDPVTGLSYSGEFYRQDGLLYILLAHDVGKDGMLMIFYDPVAGNFVETSGVFVALNLRREPTCWQAILSKSEIDDARAKTLLKGDPLTMLSIGQGVTTIATTTSKKLPRRTT